jgi:hypothetical protein
MATPNVPNSEAHIVPRLGISQESSTLVYLREKKVFQPTTLHWLKAPGSTTALRNAETEVLKEVKDLNLRFDNFWEWALWQAVQGTLVIDSPDVQANVDYKLSSSHKVTACTAVEGRVADRHRREHHGVEEAPDPGRPGQAKVAYATSDTLNLIVTSFTKRGINADVRADEGRVLQHRHPDRLHGHELDFGGQVYDVRQPTTPRSPRSASWLNNKSCIIGDFTTNRPIELLQGPTADDEAPDGFIGGSRRPGKRRTRALGSTSSRSRPCRSSPDPSSGSWRTWARWPDPSPMADRGAPVRPVRAGAFGFRNPQHERTQKWLLRAKPPARRARRRLRPSRS